jgi:MHS family proline/betaine transporter-like MFS transporter
MLPGYATIGVWAPILLVLCRLVQGFSTGGEWGGAIIFMAEYAPPGRRGFYASWMQVGVALGSLCGAGSAWVLTTILPDASMRSWGWRVPFIIGFLLLPIGYYLRTRVAETPVFQRLAAARKLAPSPLRDAFTTQLRPMALACAASFIWNSGGYVLLVFLPSFASQVLKVDLRMALLATTVGTVVRGVLTPFVGLTSDRVGRKLFVQVTNVCFLLLVYPMFWLMKTYPGFESVLVTSIISGALMGMVGGGGPVMLTEIFPTRVRSTPVGIGYNISAVVFGGFAPFICTWLVQQTGDSIAPTYLLLFCAAASFLAVTQLKDRTKASLEEL